MSRSDTTPRRAWRRWGMIAPAAIFVLTALALTGVAMRPPPGSAAPELDAEEAAFLDIINDYRAAEGRGPLALHPQLTGAADWYSNDMWLCNSWYHIDSLGRGPQERVYAFGYTRGVGENAAKGGIFPTAQGVFNAWKTSPGHNGNMLGSSYNVIGIGRVYGNGTWYWTTVFGNSTSFNQPPADTGPAPGVGCQAATATPGPSFTNAPTATNAPTPRPTNAPTPTRTPSPTPQRTQTPHPTGKSVTGDADCDTRVETEDALFLLREEAGYPIDADCIGAADVNCDGLRDTVDALAIMRWVINLPVTQPSNCTPIGS